jgi:PAS domain S-box-containing protein
MNHGVVILDSEDDVVYLNPVAEKLVDCNKEEAIGKAVEEIWEDWPIGMNPSKDAAEISKEVVVGEGNAIHAYEVRLSPLLDWRQRRAGGVLLMRDITERKQSEKALKRYAEELERSNQNLERFAYIASHDLQEPLRMVAGYTQLLARRYAGQLDQDADEFIAYAVDGASRMQELINDLLEYSRVGTRGNPFEPVETEQVIEQVFRNLQVAIEESQARITHDPLPRLMADKTQIIQLFQNLIGNAIKFRGNGALKIHVRAEEKQEDWHFAVCDNGIGIAPKYQKRIFQIFQRLHGRDEYEGTGIGLAVCKRIVERHGGRIWVESEPGEGSVFHFSMPKDARSLS